MPDTSREGKLYYSISEVADLVNVKAHVLRYWETQFKMLRPRKNRAGNRSYRAKDLQVALRIKRLLYDEGFTIAGARRRLLDERRSGQSQTEMNFVGLNEAEFVEMLKRELEELLTLVTSDPSPEPKRRSTKGKSGAAPPEPGRASGLLHEVDAMGDEGRGSG